METADLSYLRHTLTAASQKMDDMYCLELLQSLMTGYPFFPITSFSLRPLALEEILNDIVLNERKNIIEFGSGLSTLLIGRLIKKNALDTRMLSVENDERWVNVLTGLISNEGIDDAVDIICAPLKEADLAVDSNVWYDVNVLDDRITDRQFDMVIIDGPTAWQKGREKARYPALPYIFENLDKAFCIYLDDADRPGEKSVLKLWEKEYGISFSTMGGTFAYFKTAGSFCSAPIKH